MEGFAKIYTPPLCILGYFPALLGKVWGVLAIFSLFPPFHIRFRAVIFWVLYRENGVFGQIKVDRVSWRQLLVYATENKDIYYHFAKFV